jgi:hypothetical protein
MRNSAFGNNSVHANFTKRKLADRVDELVFLADGEEIGLEDEPFRDLTDILK